MAPCVVRIRNLRGDTGPAVIVVADFAGTPAPEVEHGVGTAGEIGGLPRVRRASWHIDVAVVDTGDVDVLMNLRDRVGIVCDGEWSRQTSTQSQTAEEASVTPCRGLSLIHI